MYNTIVATEGKIVGECWFVGGWSVGEHLLHAVELKHVSPLTNPLYICRCGRIASTYFDRQSGGRLVTEKHTQSM